MASINFIKKWINIMLNTIVKKKYGPTYTARFQYIFTTILYYIVTIYTNHKSNVIQEPELKFLYIRERKIDSIDQIMYQSITILFDDLGITDKSELIDNNFKLGRRSKSALQNIKNFLNYRNNDNYKTANRTIEYPNKGKYIDVENEQDLSSFDKDTWTPLKHSNSNNPQNYLTPYWGDVLTIPNINNINKYLQIADENFNVNGVPYNRQIEINEVLKVYENLNDSQRMIAEYFQGGSVTPPGIWNIYALYTIQSTETSLIQASRFFYLLNSALFMASIIAWEVKKTYIQSRPIQYIRQLDSTNITNFDGSQVNNKIWKTFQQKNFQTPPFPDYISGHSTFSSAAAVIFERFYPDFQNINFNKFESVHGEMITPLLKDNDYNNTIKTVMFKNGSSVVPTIDSHEFPTCAVKLTFNGWRDLAYNSGISRIYGGIHGNNANNAGLIIGETIAIDILNNL
jgi:hypothetical protein